MQLYTCKAVEDLFRQYQEKGGEIMELIPGVLGYGTSVLLADGYKTAVVQEVYLNEWSSAHKIRFYNKLPKKYQQMLDNL